MIQAFRRCSRLLKHSDIRLCHLIQLQNGCFNRLETRTPISRSYTDVAHELMKSCYRVDNLSCQRPPSANMAGEMHTARQMRFEE
ncbi:MAG: hypothetical protein CFE43_09305 [Burkholderiales bacterium PBB3]|nr:MAG: hypothetical protein CFE43_09305 [Burkholderiales bacterium PBB3]